jgi:hypothetical protein
MTTPINQAFLMLKGITEDWMPPTQEEVEHIANVTAPPHFPERREHSIPRKTLPSIVGDKDEFLANAAQRLKTARLTRPWERFMETRNEEFGISDARKRFPSLRHLENLKEKRDREETQDRQRKERKSRDMEYFDERQEEEREKPLDTKRSIRSAIEEFRNSAAGHDWLDLLDAHQKENKIRNITGEERQTLELPKPQISGEERMILESLKGNEQPLQNLQEKQTHEEEFFQPAPPIAVQKPIERQSSTVSETDDNPFKDLGSLFG